MHGEPLAADHPPPLVAASAGAAAQQTLALPYRTPAHGPDTKQARTYTTAAVGTTTDVHPLAPTQYVRGGGDVLPPSTCAPYAPALWPVDVATVALGLGYSLDDTWGLLASEHIHYACKFHQTSVMVGRSRELCDVIVDDPRVSAVHFCLTVVAAVPADPRPPTPATTTGLPREPCDEEGAPLTTSTTDTRAVGEPLSSQAEELAGGRWGSARGESHTARAGGGPPAHPPGLVRSPTLEGHPLGGGGGEWPSRSTVTVAAEPLTVSQRRRKSRTGKLSPVPLGSSPAAPVTAGLGPAHMDSLDAMEPPPRAAARFPDAPAATAAAPTRLVTPAPTPHTSLCHPTHVLAPTGSGSVARPTPQLRVLLEDLSTNGTYVNDVPVGKGHGRELLTGDVIAMVRLPEKQSRDGREAEAEAEEEEEHARSRLRMLGAGDAVGASTGSPNIGSGRAKDTDGEARVLTAMLMGAAPTRTYLEQIHFHLYLRSHSPPTPSVPTTAIAPGVHAPATPGRPAASTPVGPAVAAMAPPLPPPPRVPITAAATAGAVLGSSDRTTPQERPATPHGPPRRLTPAMGKPTPSPAPSQVTRSRSTPSSQGGPLFVLLPTHPPPSPSQQQQRMGASLPPTPSSLVPHRLGSTGSGVGGGGDGASGVASSTALTPHSFLGASVSHATVDPAGGPARYGVVPSRALQWGAKIGAGASGDVYTGFDIESGTLLAIKVLKGTAGIGDWTSPSSGSEDSDCPDDSGGGGGGEDGDGSGEEAEEGGLGRRGRGGAGGAGTASMNTLVTDSEFDGSSPASGLSSLEASTQVGKSSRRKSKAGRRSARAAQRDDTLLTLSDISSTGFPSPTTVSMECMPSAASAVGAPLVPEDEEHTGACAPTEPPSERHRPTPRRTGAAPGKHRDGSQPRRTVLVREDDTDDAHAPRRPQPVSPGREKGGKAEQRQLSQRRGRAARRTRRPSVEDAPVLIVDRENERHYLQLPRGIREAHLRELWFLTQLQHVRIVRCLGFQPVRHRGLCILMEYVAGGTLQSLVKSFGAFEENVIRLYALQILEGLEYLASRSVVHGDLKSANVLVSERGNVKLTDFGTSKILRDYNQPRTFRFARRRRGGPLGGLRTRATGKPPRQRSSQGNRRSRGATGRTSRRTGRTAGPLGTSGGGRGDGDAAGFDEEGTTHYHKDTAGEELGGGARAPLETPLCDGTRRADLGECASSANSTSSRPSSHTSGANSSSSSSTSHQGSEPDASEDNVSDDFDDVEEEEELFESGGKVLCGTPLYMSPELIRTQVSTTASDVWALGCVVFEMATGGILPWREVHQASPHAIIFHIGRHHDEGPSLSDLYAARAAMDADMRQQARRGSEAVPRTRSAREPRLRREGGRPGRHPRRVSLEEAAPAPLACDRVAAAVGVNVNEESSDGGGGDPALAPGRTTATTSPTGAEAAAAANTTGMVDDEATPPSVGSSASTPSAAAGGAHSPLTPSPLLVDFIQTMFTMDPQRRPRALDLLRHPFITGSTEPTELERWHRSIGDIAGPRPHQEQQQTHLRYSFPAAPLRTGGARGKDAAAVAVTDWRSVREGSGAHGLPGGEHRSSIGPEAWPGHVIDMQQQGREAGLAKKPRPPQRTAPAHAEEGENENEDGCVRSARTTTDGGRVPPPVEDGPPRVGLGGGVEVALSELQPDTRGESVGVREGGAGLRVPADGGAEARPSQAESQPDSQPLFASPAVLQQKQQQQPLQLGRPASAAPPASPSPTAPPPSNGQGGGAWRAPGGGEALAPTMTHPPPEWVDDVAPVTPSLRSSPGTPLVPQGDGHTLLPAPPPSPHQHQQQQQPRWPPSPEAAAGMAALYSPVSVGVLTSTHPPYPQQGMGGRPARGHAPAQVQRDGRRQAQPPSRATAAAAGGGGGVWSGASMGASPGRAYFNPRGSGGTSTTRKHQDFLRSQELGRWRGAHAQRGPAAPAGGSSYYSSHLSDNNSGALAQPRSQQPRLEVPLPFSRTRQQQQQQHPHQRQQQQQQPPPLSNSGEGLLSVSDRYVGGQGGFAPSVGSPPLDPRNFIDFAAPAGTTGNSIMGTGGGHLHTDRGVYSYHSQANSQTMRMTVPKVSWEVMAYGATDTQHWRQRQLPQSQPSGMSHGGGLGRHAGYGNSGNTSSGHGPASVTQGLHDQRSAQSTEGRPPRRSPRGSPSSLAAPQAAGTNPFVMAPASLPMDSAGFLPFPSAPPAQSYGYGRSYPPPPQQSPQPQGGATGLTMEFNQIHITGPPALRAQTGGEPARERPARRRGGGVSGDAGVLGSLGGDGGAHPHPASPTLANSSNVSVGGGRAAARARLGAAAAVPPLAPVSPVLPGPAMPHLSSAAPATGVPDPATSTLRAAAGRGGRGRTSARRERLGTRRSAWAMRAGLGRRPRAQRVVSATGLSPTRTEQPSLAEGGVGGEGQGLPVASGSTETRRGEAGGDSGDGAGPALRDGGSNRRATGTRRRTGAAQGRKATEKSRGRGKRTK